MTKKLFYGWWVVAATFVSFGLSVGWPYYNISFFYDYFEKTFDWSKAQITFGFPLAALLTIWVGPVLVPRFSPRKLILAGTALTCLAFLGFGKMGASIWVYWGLWFVYTVGYILSGPIPHQIIVSQWFRKRRGTAMGVLYVGVGLIGFLGSFFVKPLTESTNFHTALMVWGLMVLLAWPLAIFIHRDRPAEKGLYPDGAATPPAEISVKAHSYRHLVGRYSFWLLVAGSACSIGSIGAVNFHMKFVFQDQLDTRFREPGPLEPFAAERGLARAELDRLLADLKPLEPYVRQQGITPAELTEVAARPEAFRLTADQLARMKPSLERFPGWFRELELEEQGLSAFQRLGRKVLWGLRLGPPLFRRDEKIKNLQELRDFAVGTTKAELARITQDLKPVAGYIQEHGMPQTELARLTREPKPLADYALRRGIPDFGLDRIVRALKDLLGWLQELLNSTWRWASMIILASSIAGRLVIGGLSDKFNKKWVMVLSYFLSAMTIPLLLWAAPPDTPWPFALLFGFAMGADYMLIPLMAAEQFGVNSLARCMAIILPINTIAQTWFPYLVSVLRQNFGNYNIPMGVVVLGVALLSGVCIALLPRREKDEAAG